MVASSMNPKLKLTRIDIPNCNCHLKLGFFLTGITFKKKKSTYVAAPGLSCGIRDLQDHFSCSMWDLFKLQQVVSLVTACDVLVIVSGI